MKNTTIYQVVKRNRNSWVGTPTHAAEYQLETTCGHSHRTLTGAVRCQQKHGSDALGVLGQIERNGKPVDYTEVYAVLHPQD